MSAAARTFLGANFDGETKPKQLFFSGVARDRKWSRSRNKTQKCGHKSYRFYLFFQETAAYTAAADFFRFLHFIDGKKFI
jgi:hypothetical protein